MRRCFDDHPRRVHCIWTCWISFHLRLRIGADGASAAAWRQLTQWIDTDMIALGYALFRSVRLDSARDCDQLRMLPVSGRCLDLSKHESVNGIVRMPSAAP